MTRLLFLALCFAAAAQGDAASSLYKQALQAERRGDDLTAFSLVARAAAMSPQEEKYRRFADRLRSRAALSLAALGQLDQALSVDPGNGYLVARAQARRSEAESGSAPPTPTEIRQAEQAAEPIELHPSSGRRSFDLQGDARNLYEQVARAYGLDAVFDADFSPGPAVRFRLERVEFRRSIRALMALTSTFAIPVNERVMLVAADTQQKRMELEPTMAALLPIPQVMSVEEANEVGRVVQQLLDIRRLAVDAGRRQVYVRDTVTRVRLAKALYEELSRRRAEVMIEIKLLSASRSSLTNLGLTTPTSFPISGTAGAVPLPDLADALPLFGVQISNAGVQADWTRSEARLLSSVRLRATDGLAASLHIGDKFPIVNAIFSPIVITDEIRDLEQRGQLLQPFPSFTFEDLGLVLKMTPRIHDSREVSLTIEAEFRLLAGTSFNGVPVISTRRLSSAVRLKEGETSLVSGLALLQVSRSDSGLAGLAQIPLIGWFFRRNTWQRDESDLVLSITPRLTGLPPSEQFAQRVYHTGTDSRPVSPL